MANGAAPASRSAGHALFVAHECRGAKRGREIVTAGCATVTPVWLRSKQRWGIIERGKKMAGRSGKGRGIFGEEGMYDVRRKAGAAEKGPGHVSGGSWLPRSPYPGRPCPAGSRETPCRMWKIFYSLAASLASPPTICCGRNTDRGAACRRGR